MLGLSALLWTFMLGFDACKDAVALYMYANTSMRRAAQDSAVWWLLLIPLTPLVWWLAQQAPPRLRNWRTWILHTIAAVVFALVHEVSAAAVARLLAGDLNLTSGYLYFRRLFAYYFYIDVFTYVSLVAASVAYDYQRWYRDRALTAARLQAEASNLERLAVEARLDALRWQLNPHFLFNSLNAVGGLVRQGAKDEAVNMLSHISELLRSTLDRSTSHDITLARELELIRLYVAIERARFRDRLEVEFRVDDGLSSAQVPALLLQPLVENAIRHGVNATTDPVHVVIEARAVDERLALSVRDHGRGFDESRSSDGVGLSNTRERLAHRFGREASIELTSLREGGAEVALTLPLVMEEAA